MRRLVCLIFVGFALPAFGQANLGPINTPYLNTVWYAGSTLYPTVQSAVTAACASTNGGTVRRPYGSTDATTMPPTSGCTKVQIEDDSAAVGLPTWYSWGSSGPYTALTSGLPSNVQISGTLGVTGATTLTGALTANTVNSIGATTPGTGKFTTLNATSLGATTPGSVAATTLSASGAATLSSTLGVTGLATLSGGVTAASIGATTPGTGAFTTLGATGTSTLAAVNAASLGATTPGSVAATTLSATGTSTLAAVNATSIGATTPGTGSFTGLNLSNAVPSTIAPGSIRGSAAINVTALNTAVTTVVPGAESGILILRDVSAGGSAVYLCDPNYGVISIASNLSVNVTIAYNSGLGYALQLTQTSGALHQFNYQFIGND
jgi:hypothetical protein